MTDLNWQPSSNANQNNVFVKVMRNIDLQDCLKNETLNFSFNLFPLYTTSIQCRMTAKTHQDLRVNDLVDKYKHPWNTNIRRVRQKLLQLWDFTENVRFGNHSNILRQYKFSSATAKDVQYSYQLGLTVVHQQKYWKHVYKFNTWKSVCSVQIICRWERPWMKRTVCHHKEVFQSPPRGVFRSRFLWDSLVVFTLSCLPITWMAFCKLPILVCVN